MLRCFCFLQIELVHGLKYLSPDMLSAKGPSIHIQTLCHWQPHVLYYVATLHIFIPEHERHTIDDKPYVDIGSVIDICPQLTELRVEQTGSSGLWSPPKGELRLTPPSRRRPDLLKRVAITTCGFLTLEDLSEFLEVCPTVKTIEYKVSCAYENRPLRLPNDDDVRTLQRLRGILKLRNSMWIWEELSLHAHENNYEASDAFAFFREPEC